MLGSFQGNRSLAGPFLRRHSVMTSKQETGFHDSGENPLLAVIAINARGGIQAGETE